MVLGIKKSYHRVLSIIDNEIKSGVSPGNIILGGFSQGGALALYTGLKSPKKVSSVCYVLYVCTGN